MTRPKKNPRQVVGRLWERNVSAINVRTIHCQGNWVKQLLEKEAKEQQQDTIGSWQK